MFLSPIRMTLALVACVTMVGAPAGAEEAKETKSPKIKYSSTWQLSRVNRMNGFKLLDKNADGLISREEFDTWLQKSGKQDEGTKRLFAFWDSNSDGQVTAIEKSGLASEYAADGIRFKPYAELSDAYKKEIEEGTKGVRCMHPRKRMMRFDHNKDGSITKEEYFTDAANEKTIKERAKSFTGRDTNKDGVLTEEEYVTYDGHNYFRRRDKLRAEQLAESTGKSNKQPPATPAKTEQPKDKAATDKNAWKKDPKEKFKRINPDGDNTLTRAEFDAWTKRKNINSRKADTLFATWDGNSDGQVTFEEFEVGFAKTHLKNNHN